MRRTLLLSISLLSSLTMPTTAMAAWGNYCYPTTQVCLGKPCLRYGEKTVDYDKKNTIICKGDTRLSRDRKWEVYVPPPPNESVTVYKPEAAEGSVCTPKTNAGACLGRLCETIGETTLDVTQEHIVACLYNDYNQKVWKKMGTQSDPVLTTYDRKAEGTMSLGKHGYCALSRYAHQAWGSATYQNCTVSRDAEGNWSLYVHFQRDAEVMSPGYTICRAICRD